MANRSLFGDVGRLLNKSPVATAARRVSVFSGPPNSRKAHLEAYGGVSTLFSIVSKLANSCGEVQWRLYYKKQDGRRRYGPDDIDRKEVTKHIALDLWNKPNPFYTNSHFVETVQQHCDLAGEQWWVIADLPGTKIPGEIWPIRPDRMEPVPDPETFIKGYLYTSPDGEKVPLRTEQVIHIKMPNPVDLYRGIGPVQALMVDLDSERYTAEWNRQFFRNDASPGGVLEVPGSLGDKEWDRLADQWDDNHKGFGNAHRVAILEQGTKWNSTTYTQRDMQFVELRKIATEKIMEAFAMHGHMLGKSGDINRANADAAESVYARWQVSPRLGRIKEALNHQLLPKFGSMAAGVEFDFDDPSLEDQEAENARLTSRASAAKTLIDAGGEWASVLESVGLPAIKAKPKEKVPPALAPFQGGEQEQEETGDDDAAA